MPTRRRRARASPTTCARASSTAIQAAQDATGAEKVNVIGYCIGGTLTAASLGYMAAQNDNRVNAATFFTTQVDFEKAGDLLVYVDEEQVKWIEGRMADKGYLPGSRMADAFNLLRSNDLIWSYVVNNYMLGKDPMPFDLLYWNADSTRMPAGVHSFYLRECYMANKLAQGKMVLDNVRDRPEEGEDAGLQSRRARGSHRAAGVGVPGRPVHGRADPAGRRRVGPHRRRRQSARGQQVPVLDQ